MLMDALMGRHAAPVRQHHRRRAKHTRLKEIEDKDERHTNRFTNSYFFYTAGNVLHESYGTYRVRSSSDLLKMSH